MSNYYQVFCRFFKSGSLLFLEIAQGDCMKHSVTTSRGKTHGKKNWGPQIGSEIKVFAIFSKLHQFLLILHKTMSDIQQSCGPNSGPDDLLYANVVKHPLKLACFIGIQSCALLLVFKYFLYVFLYLFCQWTVAFLRN